MEDEIEFEVLLARKIDKRIHSIAWSPETSLNIIPKSLVFAYGTANNIYIYSSNMADKSGVQVKILQSSATDELIDILRQ